MSWQDDQKVSDLPDHGSLSPFGERGGGGAARGRALQGIDMGFTRAKVTAEDMGCRKGEKVARARWGG